MLTPRATAVLNFAPVFMVGECRLSAETFAAAFGAETGSGDVAEAGSTIADGLLWSSSVLKSSGHDEGLCSGGRRIGTSARSSTWLGTVRRGVPAPGGSSHDASLDVLPQEASSFLLITSANGVFEGIALTICLFKGTSADRPQEAAALLKTASHT